MANPNIPNPSVVNDMICHTAIENHNGSIENDVLPCARQITVAAGYNDKWQTPMCGQKFQIITQDGVPIAQGRLKNLNDAGLTPTTPQSQDVRELLGTCKVSDIPLEECSFELLQEGPEGEVLKLEEEIKKLTCSTIREYKNKYAQQWNEWDEASKFGRTSILIQNGLGGFMEGVETWLDSEASFWSSIGDFFSDLWESLKDVLGDLTDALRPDRIIETAKAIWNGACDTAKAIGHFIEKLPQEIADVYAGTMKIIENIGAIVQFIKDFTAGNWYEVETFIDDILPNLCEDRTKTEEWATMIRNNAETWAIVLELMNATRAPALLIAAITGICAAIPPQVWAEYGAASVTIITIEVIITIILALLTGLAATATAGAAIPVGITLFVGRAAKLAKMGGRTWTFISTLINKMQAFIEKLVELGKAAVASRRRNTAQDSRITVGGMRATQRRDQDEKGDTCGICSTVLGENGHPNRTPNRNGIIKREGNGRTTAYGPGGAYSDVIVKNAMIKAQPHSHPVNQGVSMTHHHIIMLSSLKGSIGTKLEKLGYVVHDPGNLVLMPNHEYGACHLEVQLHRARHTKKYEVSVNFGLRNIQAKIIREKLCKAGETNTQQKINNISRNILTEISKFEVELQHDNNKFKPGESGCGDDECKNRDHGPRARKMLRINGAAQATSRTRQTINFPKTQWTLKTGA